MSERKNYPPKFGKLDLVWLGGLLLMVVIGLLIVWLA